MNTTKKIRETTSRFLDDTRRTLVKEQMAPVQPTSSTEFMPPQAQVEVNASLDQAVDRYLIRYERESIPENGVAPASAGVGVTTPPTGNVPPAAVYESLYSLLEQLDEEEPADDEEDAGDDAGGLDDTGGDDAGGLGGDTADLGGGDLGGGGAPADGGDENAQPVVATPKIDLSEFARSVARLVGSYDSLLDPRTIIINRAAEFIKSNYDEKTSQELLQMLELNYSLKPVNVANNAASDQQQFPTPYTAGAFGGGGGGA